MFCFFFNYCISVFVLWCFEFRCFSGNVITMGGQHDGVLPSGSPPIIFTARRVCIVRTMPWQLGEMSVCLPVCPSVCPSVRHTPVLCLNDYTYPQSFSPSGSPTILVFHTKRNGNIPTGTPWTGASNARVVWKNHDFRPISRFISEIMQSHPSFEMVPVWNDLEWPLTQISRSRYYSTSNN